MTGTLDLENVTLTYPLTFQRCFFTASPNLEAATLPRLSFTGSRLPGLCADGVQLRYELTLDGIHSTGEIRALVARIGGQLVLTRASLINPAQDTLSLDGATIAGSLVADAGFISKGQIRAYGASIGGQLDLTAATLTNPDGDTLLLDGATITGDLVARDGFKSTGQIRAPGASIGGQLSLTGATLINPSGHTLFLQRTTITGGLFARDGFVSTGQICVRGASISGQLDLSGATLTMPGGKPFDLQGATIAGLKLAGLQYCQGTLDLTACEIGDLTLDDGDDAPAPPPLSSATGWKVRDIHGGIRRKRSAAAAWLRTPRRFTAQPWEELARVYDRNGQPVDARRLRFEATLRSMWTNRHHKWATLARLGYGLTVGFGYYPLVAAVWLVLFLGGAWGLTAANSDQFVPTVTTARATTPGPAGTAPAPPPGCPTLTEPLSAATSPLCRTAGYPDLDPLSYALATVTPAGALTAPAWAPAPGATRLSVTLTAFKLAGWLMTAFLLAGLTGLLRKG